MAKPLVRVLDNGPIHVGEDGGAAFIARAHWLAVEWLRKYAPEWNEVEFARGDRKARPLANPIFTDLVTLEAGIRMAVAERNTTRVRDPQKNQRDSV